jgi:hypothetical protein
MCCSVVSVLNSPRGTGTGGETGEETGRLDGGSYEELCRS